MADLNDVAGALSQLKSIIAYHADRCQSSLSGQRAIATGGQEEILVDIVAGHVELTIHPSQGPVMSAIAQDAAFTEGIDMTVYQLNVPGDVAPYWKPR